MGRGSRPRPGPGLRVSRSSRVRDDVDRIELRLRVPATLTHPSLATQSPHKRRGRRECRVIDAPAASRAKEEAHEQSHHRYAETIRHSLRNGFNGFLRALLGDRAFLSPSFVDHSTTLASASGRQNHTTSPSAKRALVSCALKRPSHPASRFVTIAHTPLLPSRDTADR